MERSVAAQACTGQGMTGQGGQQRPLTLVIAGGGTGGHLFPAIAVHEELERLSGGVVPSVWLCSDRSIDARILEARGHTPVPLAAKPLSLHPRRLLRFLGGWAPSVRTSRAILRDLREAGGRVVMLSTGGFAAAPAVQAARVEGCAVHALVLDQPPGKATRWIMGRSKCVYDASLSGLVTRQEVQRVGPVVRAEAVAPQDRDACCAHWGLDAQRPVLLVTGGSLGARSLNEFVGAFIERHAQVLNASGWQVLHQVGGSGAGGGTEEDGAHAYAARYEACGVRASVTPLLHPMGAAWGAATLAVCRAGAGTVAEAGVNAVPTAFMPYPYHRDQHQEHNAKPLVDLGGAMLWTDRQTSEANMGAHAGNFLELLNNPGQLQAMRKALRSWRQGFEAGSGVLEQGAPAETGARAVARSILGQVA